MKLSLQTLLRAARDTLVNPASAARYVMGLGLDAGQGLMALGLTAVCATLLTAMMQAFMGPIDDPAMQEMFNRPFILAISQFGLMALGAFLMWRVGRVFGGKGSFAQSLALVAWLEVVLILLQVAALVVQLALPLFALPVGLSLCVFLFADAFHGGAERVCIADQNLFCHSWHGHSGAAFGNLCPDVLRPGAQCMMSPASAPTFRSCNGR